MIMYYPTEEDVKKKNGSKVQTGLLILSCSMIIMACVQHQSEATSTEAQQPAPEAAKAVQAAEPTAFPSIAVLAISDCVKCHETVVHQNMDAGASHKTEVSCLECHDSGHPPSTAKEEMIPECAMCHEGEPHYEVENCLGCHENPHQPLKIVFGKDNVAVCNTCHAPQVTEVQANPSAHAELDCAECHYDNHGYVPDCMECHDTHREGQKFAECVSCHAVHQPTNVAYDQKIPNLECAACHDEVTAKLVAGQTKHAELQCVFCHQDTHGKVPACNDCHGIPHPDVMMKKFPNCLDCHLDPHNLASSTM